MNQNQNVYLPAPKVAYLVSTLNLSTNQSLSGPGKETPGLVGKGAGPVLAIGNPADPSVDARGVNLSGINIYNTNYSAVAIYNSPNFIIDKSTLVAYATDHVSAINTLEIRRSYRGIIQASTIGQSGGGWAISAMDNCNSLSILNNIITAGTGGQGDIAIGASQSVRIENNTMEISAGYGIQAGGTLPAGLNGQVTGIEIKDNYMEQIVKPISLGEGFIVSDAVVSGNYVVDNPNAQGVAERAYFINLGRVQGASIFSNSYSGSFSEPFVNLSFVTAPNSIQFLMDSTIQNNTFSTAPGSTPTPYALHSFPSGNVSPQATLFGSNLLSFSPSQTTGVERQFLSPVLQANQTFPQTLFVAATPNGGKLERIDIVQPNGDIHCTVDVGSDISILELASFDPGTLLGSPGQPPFPVPLSNGSVMRPNHNGYFRIRSGGTGTGTFQLLFTYRN